LIKVNSSHFILLNLSVFFISTSGVLGRWIALPPEVSIFWRSLIAIPLLIAILKLSKQSLRAVFQWDLKLLLAGLFMGTHWVTYFYALQWSNVAIGMLSLFTYPVITAFLEPLFFKTRFEKRHLFVGGLTFLGVYFLVPSFALAQTHGWALAIGIFSAFCYAMRNLLLKGATKKQSGLQLMLFQVVIISLCFLPFMSLEKFQMSIPFWWALLFLALFTTVIGHSLFLHSLKYFTVTAASLMSSINPLYGILIAYLFLNEVPHWGVYIGGTLIIFAVLFENRFSR
jgi:drug/metabolite transporter (DMT)-like permease